MTSDAIQALLQQYTPRMRSEARRYRVDKDDLSQQAAWHLLRETKAQVHMLLVIRRAANELAGRRRRKGRPIKQPLNELVDVIDLRSTKNGRLEAQEAIELALSSATPTERQIIAELLAGQTFQELAARLDLKVATAKSQFRRFVIRVRAVLTGDNE